MALFAGSSFVVRECWLVLFAIRCQCILTIHFATTRGLTERQVNSAADVLNLMQKAQHSRIIGETKMNKASSRSHCLFTIQVHGKIALIDGDGDMEFNGKLHMVE
jgi:hypothetical protein